MRFRVAGSGDPVVLLHGLSGSSHWWDRNVDELSKRLQVYALDLPSFGNNKRWGKFVLHDAAGRIVDWMNVIGLDRPSVIGHSMGGWIAADLAARWPERVDRLLLVDAPLEPDARSLFRLSTAGLAAARVLPPAFVPVLIADALRAGPFTIRSAGLSVRKAGPGLELERIDATRLVIWGERDRLLPLEYGRQVAAAARADLHVIAGGGHNPMWDQPEAFNRIALQFLSRNEGEA